jgi:hypothetical protein
MIEFHDEDYRALCRAGRVQAELGALDEKRAAAIRRFWLFLVGGILLSVAIAAALVAYGLVQIAITLAIVAFSLGIVLAIAPLARLGHDIKVPILETLAAQGGMAYAADGFAAPVYAEARRILFGRFLSRETFTDLFHGADAEGLRYAVYEAKLMRRSGKSSHTIFAGQVYAWQRRAPGGAEIAIVPDRGIFNFFKPSPGALRVKFDSDPEFERRFEVYATDPAAAQLLIDSEVRRLLLELRQAGRVFGYVGQGDMLVAVTGKDRFEPGGMFRSTPGEARVRAMFDDVCASLATLRRLRAALG